MTDPDSHPDFRLEWVELYNNSSSPLSMENWTVNGAPFSMTLEAYSCGVIVRQAEGEDSFASVYGNQNGVWGDAPGEEYPCVQASLSLVNGGGSLIIADDSGIPVLQRDYPADEGETEDNTICLYSEGIWEYERVPGGTPGEARLMISLDFTDSAVKRGCLFQNGEEVCAETCTGLWRILGLPAGLSYAVEISYNGAVLYSQTLLLREDFCQTVDLGLPDPSAVIFLFFDSTGVPLEKADIAVEWEGAEVFSGTLENGSSVELYPGIYGVYAGVEGLPGRYEEFSVSGPEEVSITFPDPGNLLISEIAPFGEPEWVEIRSLAEGEVTLRGVALGDNTGVVLLDAERVHFDDYLVLTEDEAAFSSLWGEGLSVREVSSFPALNDTGDVLSLCLGETVCDRVEYGPDWYDGERPASFERIMPLGVSGPENFYGTQNPTPGRPNSVEGMLNGERKLRLREVSPFTEEEYVECFVLDDGTGGRGALFCDYVLTDLDTEVAFQKKIFFPGETVLVRGFSLNQSGDQACLIQGETVRDAFAWREKYKEVSPEEEEDFAFLEEAGFNLLLFEEPDATLSFQYKEGAWVLAGATPGVPEGGGEETDLYLPDTIPLEAGSLPLAYSLDSMTELKIFLFDAAGFRLFEKKVLLSGEGEISLDIPRKRGRYIFFADFRRGEKSGRIQKTFVVY